MALPSGLLLAPADSARAIGEVYGISLLATLPLLAAGTSLLALRRASGGARVTICRAAVVALLAMYVGRFLPVHWMVWIVPEGLAAPLVALGRLQLSSTSAGAVDALPAAVTANAWGAGGVGAILALYWCGVAFMLLRLVRGRWRLRQLLATASALDSRRWRSLLLAAGRAAGVEAGTLSRARLYTSKAARVPMTWGAPSRPVIVIPPAATRWEAAQLHAALVHECSHIAQGDARFALASQVMCALYWFHPGVWWLSRELQQTSELACDDRVLLSGVRRSDYAELLVIALGAKGSARFAAPAIALVQPSGIRGRLSAIVDTARVLRTPSPVAVTAAIALSALVAIPLGTVRVSPTRDVLTTLMRDGRWESRAYAVVRLAQRADSVEVARDAAAHDPSPEVRAWAHYALAREGSAAPIAPRRDALPLPLHDEAAEDSAAAIDPVASPAFQP